MRDNLYEQACQEIQEYRDAHPNTTRADRFNILAKLIEVPEETVRTVDRYQRAIREIYPPDCVCTALEKEWHSSPTHKNEEYRLNKESRLFELPNRLS